MTNINQKFIEDMGVMRQDISELFKIDKEDKVDLLKTNSVIEGEKIKISQLFKQLEAVDQEVKVLKAVKQDQGEYVENIARIDEILHRHDLYLEKVDDHCNVLDQYLDKF